MSLPALIDHLKQTAALSQIMDLISWDREAMMPKKGLLQRSEQTGALAAVIHARNADSRIPDWIAAINERDLSPFDRRNVAEARRSYDRATRIPERLATESAKAASEGQIIWAEARAKKDFQAFLPALRRIIALKRKEAACLTEAGASLYDALLDTFEPGTSSANLRPMLEGLRPRLISLREKILEKPSPAKMKGHFPKETQLALAKRTAALLGYDFDAGRIDTVTHPFCSGCAGDVRVTTRVDEANPFNCLYATIHEVGHALYAQGAVDPFLPAANFCSMGIHESQSRFWENQIGRSRPFADWLYPAMTETFGGLPLDGPDALYAVLNKVETGFIRTEADEVHYNLHILLRFELEQELIGGTLDVDDLEEAYNTRFLRDFGLVVPDPSLGVLQDAHWSAGLFGYFPTYSLGNIYSACLDKAMREAIPDRDELLSRTETTLILDWLREKVHSQGRLLSATDLIEAVSGSTPTAEPLLDYLEEKFRTLYGV